MHGTLAKTLSFVLVWGHLTALARPPVPETTGHANDEEANKQIASFLTTVISKSHFPAINGIQSDERPDAFLTAPAFTIPATKRLHLCVYDTESLDYQVCKSLPRERCVPDESDNVRCQWMERQGHSWCGPHTQALCEQRLARIKGPEDAYDTMGLSELENLNSPVKRYTGIETLDLIYEGHGPPAHALGQLAGYFARNLKTVKTLDVTSHGCTSFKSGKHTEFPAGFAEAALNSEASGEEKARVKAIVVNAHANQLHSFYRVPEGKAEIPFLSSDTPLSLTVNWKWWGTARAVAQITKYYDCRSQTGNWEGRRCTEEDEKEKLKGRCFATLPPPYVSQSLNEYCGSDSLIKFWKLRLELPKLPAK